ncbi:hypothetical protein BLA13014_02191 [Burkholderia aenigmatica]|uniref:Uncharacterized protein n=1 Tax=Burkholderia aenigmatica TaxID=2015348 RepID=A0A6P2K6B7_9BURK|nr:MULTISPECIES: hypothetical protein [Burkholderia]VWB50560.1 hypothetical protein BLA13014_02191 [Burkholderia aenigmatica]
MTHANEQRVPVQRASPNRPPLWLATILTVFGLAALSLASFFGFSTGYCNDLGGAVVWVVLYTAAAIYGVFKLYRDVLPVGLVACIALAEVVRRLQRFRVTWLRFLIALLCVYGATALLAWLGSSHSDCRVL